MMTIIIAADGTVRCLYGEMIELAALGELWLARASFVEPDERASWWADLSNVDGPVLGPFPTRSAGLAAEVQWLHEHWLRA